MEKSLIKYWLSKNNMSQRELAEKLGINENTLSLKINGSLSTTNKDALKIFKILNIYNLEERAKIFLN